MLRKKEVYTNITPIPSYVPRQLAIDILHSHGEIITLNPLVLSHHPIKAPRGAASDEYYSTWYEIIERIQYVPGLGKMGSGKISFKGCFHDVPWGLQTHIYAPMGVDLRNKWRIAGNQPGEPPEPLELGLVGAPANGLYLREDIEIECNLTLVSFVKSQMKAASKVLVDRLIKKAELLDAGVLQAMMEDGRLRTFNPADRSSTMQSQQPSQSPQLKQEPLSPRLPYQMPQSPTGFLRPGSISGEPQPNYFSPPQYGQTHHTSMAVELPGDAYLQPPYGSEKSGASPEMNNSRWSGVGSATSSRPTSYSSDASGFRSPGLDKGYATELPTMKESREEQDMNQAATLKQFESRDNMDQKTRYMYNPQHFAYVGDQESRR